MIGKERGSRNQNGYEKKDVDGQKDAQTSA
jgi:hypothetical protein